jgi:hypothetical protein
VKRSGAVATQAVNVVVKGMGRKNVAVNSAQTAGAQAPASANTSPPPAPESGF